MRASFELQQKLEDHIPDTEADQRAWLGEIIDRIKIVGTDGSGLLRIDQELGSRPASE